MCPLLQTRFILSRLHPPILDAPHLDLLPPSRRVWRGRFESCALGTLEQRVLGVQRSQDDIMSWLIPDLYRQYLRGGDNGEMRQVLYHNAVDILSLVVLAERLCRLLADPLAEDIDPRERVALARWFEALNLHEQAETTYRIALDGWLPLARSTWPCSAWRRCSKNKIAGPKPFRCGSNGRWKMKQMSRRTSSWPNITNGTSRNWTER